MFNLVQNLFSDSFYSLIPVVKTTVLLPAYCRDHPGKVGIVSGSIFPIFLIIQPIDQMGNVIRRGFSLKKGGWPVPRIQLQIKH